MEKSLAQIITKNEALKRLGVQSAKVRHLISSHVDLVHRGPNGQLVAANSFMPATLACVTGAAVLTNAQGDTFQLDEPFVVDQWAADDRRIAHVSLRASQPVSIVVIDWTVRDLVFGHAPRLQRLSRATKNAVAPSTATSTRIVKAKTTATTTVSSTAKPVFN